MRQCEQDLLQYVVDWLGDWRFNVYHVEALCARAAIPPAAPKQQRRMSESVVSDQGVLNSPTLGPIDPSQSAAAVFQH